MALVPVQSVTVTKADQGLCPSCTNGGSCVHGDVRRQGVVGVKPFDNCVLQKVVTGPHSPHRLVLHIPVLRVYAALRVL